MANGLPSEMARYRPVAPEWSAGDFPSTFMFCLGYLAIVETRKRRGICVIVALCLGFRESRGAQTEFKQL